MVYETLHLGKSQSRWKVRIYKGEKQAFLEGLDT